MGGKCSNLLIKCEIVIIFFLMRLKLQFHSNKAYLELFVLIFKYYIKKALKVKAFLNTLNLIIYSIINFIIDAF